jgi:hypothetical protein
MRSGPADPWVPKLQAAGSEVYAFGFMRCVWHVKRFAAS